ncbi:MAG: polyprenyl synthetase family protein [Microbacterium sp.]|uniref:polyprenyl synthetase family protein n=1 Tax=Microbacterium sp. TaxID=51671 RepID=UPI0039E4B627
MSAISPMSGVLSPAAATDVSRRVDKALDVLQARATRHDPALARLTGAATRAAHGGKRFRPALLYAAFEAWNGDPAHRDGVADLAAAVELLHTAFVIHDDVIDHDTTRRGRPNVAGEFIAHGRRAGVGPAQAAELGVAAGVLGGDLLLHEASRLVALAPLPAGLRRGILDLFDEAVLVSTAGELSDVEHTLGTAATVAGELLRTAHDKTAAYSFTLPLCAGAMLAGADADEVVALRACGSDLGLAFQLVDDLIGAFGTPAQAGRDAGADLREGKRTPLVALAIAGPDAERVEGTLALARTGPVGVRVAQRALERSGARTTLVAMATDALERARGAAAVLPAQARELVARVADDVERRIP